MRARKVLRVTADVSSLAEAASRVSLRAPLSLSLSLSEMVAKKRVTKVVDTRKPTHSLDAARPSKGGKGRDAATVSE